MIGGDEAGELSYVLVHQAWYGHGSDPALVVRMTDPGGGERWSCRIVGLGAGLDRRMLHGDVHAVSQAVPELAEALEAEGPLSLREVVELLDRLGATDKTERDLVQGR